MNTKRRNHCENDHAKVEEHDYGLTPSMPPKTPLPCEQPADEQHHTHGNLKKQSYVGIGRSPCS
jgi:hypothetical protein